MRIKFTHGILQPFSGDLLDLHLFKGTKRTYTGNVPIEERDNFLAANPMIKWLDQPIKVDMNPNAVHNI